MNEEKYSFIYSLVKKYVILTITVVLSFVSIFLSLNLFRRESLNGITPFILVLMFFCMFSFVLVMSLLLTKKKQNMQTMSTLNTEGGLIKENDENYDKLRLKIIELEKNVSRISESDLDYIKTEYAKDAIISRVKNSSSALKRKINTTLENFERPMQLSLICAIAFAIAGLIPLCYLIFKGNSETIQSSISVVMVSRWPFLGLTFVFEFVAGVFLKIYYRLVDEIKYYINESVRINEKAIGLETLVRLNRTEEIDSFVEKMVDTSTKCGLSIANRSKKK